MADLRFSSERAKYGMAYVRMALIPGDGGAYYLPRIVGMSKALELMWTGRIFDAQEALAMGYVTRVVPGEELMEQTLDFANDICRMPAVSVQLIKRLALPLRRHGPPRGARNGRPRDGHREVHPGRCRRAQSLLGEAGARLQGLLTPGRPRPTAKLPTLRASSRGALQAADGNRCAGGLCSPPAGRGEMPKAEGGPRPRLSSAVVPSQTGPGPLLSLRDISPRRAGGEKEAEATTLSARCYVATPTGIGGAWQSVGPAGWGQSSEM